jgi:hypothetical protein
VTEEEGAESVADLVGVEPTDVASEAVAEEKEAGSKPDYVETVPASTPELAAGDNLVPGPGAASTD